MPVQPRLRDGVLVVIYLHGFASSSQSGKATYLGQRLRAKGVKYAAPDLNLPDFSTLTVTRMIEQTHALIANEPEPVTLIGSSHLSVSKSAMNGAWRSLVWLPSLSKRPRPHLPLRRARA